MSRWNATGRLAVLALAGVSTFGLSACGKRGQLDTPPPLFGDRAQARYEAQRQQSAQDAADARAHGTTTPAADQPDDGPLTTRDIKAPEQRNVPASRQSIDGAPNPLGPAINPNPPN